MYIYGKNECNFLKCFLICWLAPEVRIFYTDAYLRHYRTSEKAEEEYARTYKRLSKALTHIYIINRTKRKLALEQEKFACGKTERTGKMVKRQDALVVSPSPVHKLNGNDNNKAG